MNNNKAKNDGRAWNRRKGRTKIIKNEGKIKPAMSNKPKKDRAKLKSIKAIKKVFGSEDGVWVTMAEKAKEGSTRHMEMLMGYAYGKAGESRSTAPQLPQAPVINFINGPKPVDNTIDITPEDE